MTLHFRNGRKFPQRISKEELYELTQQKLGECGVDVVAQAQFTSLMCKSVVGNNNYMFLSLQPRLKLHTDPAWRAAYTVAISFLQTHQMQITLDTIQTEARNNKLPSHSKILQMAPEKGNVLSLLREMVLQSSQGSTPTFREYVVNFSKREKLPISPSTAIPQGYKNTKPKQKTKSPTNTTYQSKASTLMSSGSNDINQQPQQQWQKQQNQSFLNNNNTTNTSASSKFLNNNFSNINSNNDNANNFGNSSLLQRKQQPQQSTLPSYSFPNKQEPISQSPPKKSSFEAQPFSSGEGDFDINDDAENVPQPMISADHSYSSASSTSNARNKLDQQSPQPQTQQSKFGLLSNLSQQQQPKTQTSFNNNDRPPSPAQSQPQPQQSKFGLLSNLSQQQQQPQQQLSGLFGNTSSQLLNQQNQPQPQQQTQQPKFGFLSNLSQQSQQQPGFLNNSQQFNQSQNSTSPTNQNNNNIVTEEEEAFESFISDVDLSSGAGGSKKSGNQSNAASPTATKKSSAGPSSKSNSINADNVVENIDDVDDFVSDIPSVGDSVNSNSNSMKASIKSEKEENDQVETENIADDFQEEEAEEIIYDDFDIEVPESPGAPPGSPQGSPQGSKTQSIVADDSVFDVDDDVEDIGDDFDLGT